MRRLALVACALLALSGCGGGQRQTQVAATLVPPGASSYLRIRTAQVPQAGRALARFPTRDTGALSLPAVLVGAGPELDVATLAGGRVFFTQPSDPKAFDKRLDATGRVHARLLGWTVFARRRDLLDAVRHRRSNLADEAWYGAASKTLPAEAAVRQLTRGWQATALTLTGGDAELVVHRLTPPVLESPSPLAAAVPADAIVAAGIASPGSVPAGAPALLRALAVAVDGPLFGWVRPGADLPEVTVVATPADPRHALRETARFVARLTKNPSAAAVTVDGARLRQVSNGAIDLYYGLVRDRLVLSDSGSAAANAGFAGKSLAAVSQLPGSTESWTYLDVPAGLPLAHAYAGLFDLTVPPALEARLAPLRAVLHYESREGRVATTVTRLALRQHP
jgi:hypothetical protein